VLYKVLIVYFLKFMFYNICEYWYQNGIVTCMIHQRQLIHYTVKC